MNRKLKTPPLMDIRHHIIATVLTALPAVPTVLLAQSGGRNYIVSETMLNASGSQSIRSVQYYDAYGRPRILASGGASPSGKYLYTMAEYDSLGRESRTWLPATGTTSPLTKPSLMEKCSATPCSFSAHLPKR